MTFATSLFLCGIILLATIIGLFWMKDQLRNPILARFSYSGLVARLAVIGAVFAALGLMLILSNLVN